MEFDIIVKNILENFKDSIMTDDKGTKRSVESVVRFAENNKEKYFKKNFPINKLEHDLKWWDDQNKKDTKISPKTEHLIDTTLTETGDDVPEGHTPDADSAMTTMYKKNNRIDYASTVEDAYGDLNKILGGDGIKRLTEDTQKLMGQQMQLADAMKSMTPLLTQAKTLLGSFDMKQFGNITAMAKQFGASE